MNYSIVSLSDEQLAQRRILLDDAGYVAWLSPLIIVAILYQHRRFFSRPLTNHSSTNASTAVTRLRVLGRKASWILDQRLTAEFGSLKVHLMGLAYAVWLVYLVVRKTGEDYMHVTKAFGHVAVSQLPFQYLLAIKSPVSPIQIATGLSHENLNDYHRLFGRIVHTLLATHAILYLRFFVVAGLLTKRIQSSDVRLGLTAFWLFNFLAVLSIPPIRKKAYHALFYRSHVVITAVVLPVLYYHVPYTRKYVIQAGILYAANLFLRLRVTSNKVRVPVEKIKGTDLLHLRVKLGAAVWAAGQHVYLKQTNHPLTPKTPFTIASRVVPEQPGEHTVQLVIRNLNGPQTGWLASNEKVDVFLEGPYGESKSYMPELLKTGGTQEPVLLVAGGVGATYTLPIYASLLHGSTEKKDVTLIWVVQSVKDAQWGIDYLRNMSLVHHNVVIYTTQPSDDVASDSEHVKIVSLGQRPDIQTIVDEVLGSPAAMVLSQEKDRTTSYPRANVLACGPPGLSKALRKAVGRHVLGYGREVLFHEEQFGLGSV